MQNALIWASIGTGFTFLMTALGATTVFLFKGKINSDVQKVFLGFAAGVMIAASVWSLLIPAINEASSRGKIGLIPAAGGFALGIAFILLLDSFLPHLHPGSDQAEGVSASLRRTTLLVFAVTLHNIPEGMATGLAFALASQQDNNAGIYAAVALAIGMGIQNFPEGAAIALPLRQEGFSKGKAFMYAALSGVVEPIFGILAALIAIQVAPYMPWLLSFAAGAMMYVIVEELIPEANLGEHSHKGTLGVMAGFLIMMILDVALG